MTDELTRPAERAWENEGGRLRPAPPDAPGGVDEEPATGQNHVRPLEPGVTRVFKTPLDYLLERRSEAECEALLAEALQRLRAHRRGRAHRGRAQGTVVIWAVMTRRPEYPRQPWAESAALTHPREAVPVGRHLGMPRWKNRRPGSRFQPSTRR